MFVIQDSLVFFHYRFVGRIIMYRSNQEPVARLVLQLSLPPSKMLGI